ncbi:unnamed protein product [Ambrosiozyma monospora]|uniref:Unnamed protein product n=1 Tax=Ambrosiozyma monospora TaxID=43982 RepID=A0ACB5TB54_AMBMO|nr:unnamed protein product [Ambrosiozyma monospora]
MEIDDSSCDEDDDNHLSNPNNSSSSTATTSANNNNSNNAKTTKTNTKNEDDGPCCISNSNALKNSEFEIGFYEFAIDKLLNDAINRFDCLRCHHMMCPYCIKARLSDVIKRNRHCD